MKNSTERWYGYICTETFTKKYPDEDVTYEKDQHYPSYIVANLPREERNRYFRRNYPKGDVVVQP